MAQSKTRVLTDAAIQKQISGLAGWRHSRGALRCRFQFETFAKALQFVNRVARLAEEADHHPDIDIRYRVVRLALSTHDAGGITDKDVALARLIDLGSAPRKEA